MQVQWRLAVAAGVSLLAHAVFILAVRPLSPTAPVSAMRVVLETGGSSKLVAAHASGHPPASGQLRSHKALSATTSKVETDVMQDAKALSPQRVPAVSGPSGPVAMTGGLAHQPGDGSGRGTGQGAGEHASVQAARFLGNASHPPYPEQARQRGEQGRVELKVRVGRDAQVKEVLVLRSSGFPQLDDAAQTLLRNGPFAAARKGDVPIESWLRIGVPFTLQ